MIVGIHCEPDDLYRLLQTVKNPDILHTVFYVKSRYTSVLARLQELDYATDNENYKSGWAVGLKDPEAAARIIATHGQYIGEEADKKGFVVEDISERSRFEPDLYRREAIKILNIIK